MQFHDIERWLDITEFRDDSCNNYNVNGRRAIKRQRLNPLSTPPSSHHANGSDDMADASARDGGKRPLDDQTSRPKRHAQAASYPSLSSASSDHSSRHSDRSSSPRKQRRMLQMNPQGLELQNMNDFADRPRPPALRTLLRDIKAFAYGRGVVERAAQAGLAKAAEDDELFDWALEDSGAHLSDHAGLVGRTPGVREVRFLMQAAFECDKKLHPECNWNLDVHREILKMAYRPDDPWTKTLVNAMGSTTASIIPDYGIPMLSKKVDFCIYVDPKNNPSLSSTRFEAAYAYTQSLMPQGILNFTDFAPLDGRFIAVSIETKKPSENFEAAQLQLGVWDRAHWQFLQRLASLLPGADVPKFLPGIIVQGHYWFLVVTTLDGGKTTFWHSLVLGSTADPLGVYQIVRTLEYLGDWARDVHWPWLRAVIEGIGEQGGL
ncbi:hypothetical protein LLEC1_07107 [Akanthomyces lecanii]|uniref:PD-(D/E)XK nuclease-like domain-containing protein n=1 Tax=Cordyceps confragosa TaxID=2714763 RepID=A0A179IMP2_CORDF|nr:hypothetical protein LLEC1_07107 [Akanthomyces lecanii]